MKNRYKILSLVLVLLMMAGATISTHKKIFGHEISNAQKTQTEVRESDVITTAPDGSTIIHVENLPEMKTGYAGPVPLDIYIGEDGRITAITPLPNSETPTFFRRASALFPQWSGKTPAEALAMKVDGISGATFSSGAIINNVTVGLDYYTGVESRRATSVPWKIWVALAVTLAACIIPLFVKNRHYHTVQLIANVAVLGFWCGQFLDYTLILRYMADGMELPVAIVAVVMLIAAFIYPLFGHPQHYCNNICPLGSAQILVAQLCHYKIRISAKVLKNLDRFRRLLWAALMLLLWADCLTGWLDLELFQAFQFESASWWIIGAAIVFVALSAVVARPYCRFVCPTGSLFKRSENIG